MNDDDAIRIERACEQLIIDSAIHNDRKAWADLASLYTADGVVVRPNGERLEGRAAIEASYAATPADRVTRHLCTNLRVHVDGPDAAHALTTVMIVFGFETNDPEVAFGIQPSDHHLVGEFDDCFVRTDQGWRIAERRASMVMQA